MAKHVPKSRESLKRPSIRTRSREDQRSRDKGSYPDDVEIAAERLREAIESERENLSKAESVLGCLAIAMEYETVAPSTPYYPDVAQVAREIVRQSIDRLDSLTLRRRMAGREVEEESHIVYCAPPVPLRHGPASIAAPANIQI